MTYPAHKGVLQSSLNYTWNTADSLGRGASAVVYLGRKKSNGQVVAVKLFHEHIRMVVGGEDMRELDLLRRLRHENIITLYDIEHESVSKRTVLIMHYCEGGSLYHMLDQPQYAHGLPEEEFLLVLKHVGSGIEYLRRQEIVHRDIKPGNIMRAITEDGKSVYKLTDFGAARQLNEEENFTSLYGTEEYLHPGIYERAVLRLPTNKSFNATVDLWSLGVTLYHVATGKLPFQPYGGRQNRETMFRIISQKESGVISGVQNFENGPINFSRELPPTCPLSSGLKAQVTPLLAGLMEPDGARVLSYEAFFKVADNITSQVCLNVFNYNASTDLKLYIEGFHTFSALQEMIAHHSDTAASEQLLLVKGRPLDETVDIEAKIESYPVHVIKGTIYLFQQDFKTIEKEKVIHPDIPRVPDFVNFINMEKDVKLSHTCLARAHVIKRYTETTVKKQVHLVEGEQTFRSYLTHKLKCTGERFLPMAQLIQESRKRFETFYFLVEMIQNIVRSLGCIEPYLDDILKDKTLKAVHEKAEERTTEIMRYRTALVERMDDDESKSARWCARCEDTDCLSKVDHHMTTIASIHSRFRRDKNVKDEMTSHDQNIHGFERQKLQDQCVAISSILQDHCFKNLEIMYSEAMSKVSSLAKNLNRILKIEKNIDSVIDCQQLLSSKLDKLEAKAKEALTNVQRWASGYRENPTAPPSESMMELTAQGAGKGKDTGLGESCITEQRQGAQARQVFDKHGLSITPSVGINTDLRSLWEESLKLKDIVEENTEIMKRLEESAFQSTGSISRQLSQT